MLVCLLLQCIKPGHVWGQRVHCHHQPSSDSHLSVGCLESAIVEREDCSVVTSHYITSTLSHDVRAISAEVASQWLCEFQNVFENPLVTNCSVRLHCVLCLGLWQPCVVLWFDLLLWHFHKDLYHHLHVMTSPWWFVYVLLKPCLYSWCLFQI